MPYERNQDLPERVRDNLPSHAQDIYREAFNSAWDQYAEPEDRRDEDDSREATAHKVAWSAVENEYGKDDDGQWRRRDED